MNFTDGNLSILEMRSVTQLTLVWLIGLIFSFTYHLSLLSSEFTFDGLDGIEWLVASLVIRGRLTMGDHARTLVIFYFVYVLNFLWLSVILLKIGVNLLYLIKLLAQFFRKLDFSKVIVFRLRCRQWLSVM